jgi:hypothetical protein
LLILVRCLLLKNNLNCICFKNLNKDKYINIYNLNLLCFIINYLNYLFLNLIDCLITYFVNPGSNPIT